MRAAASAVSAERMALDIEAIAGFSEEDPHVGYSRPTFSHAWRQARDYVIGEARAAGCETRVDPAGNLHARPQRLGWDAPAWLCGSHIDSVPTGGKYDGVVGVAVALEALRALPDAPLELVVFAEEEGTTFSLGMLGSRAWAGAVGPEELSALVNSAGLDYLSAGASHGVDSRRIEAERFSPASYRGLIETHIEQGPGLWKAGDPLAVVTAIHGRRQYRCRIGGTANHAGSTRMADRRDALAGAAQVITSLEALARELDGDVDHTVLTVGRIAVEPNAVNVIPGHVSLSIDFRSPSDAQLEHGDERLRAEVTEIAARRGLDLELSCTEKQPVVPLDRGVCEMLREAARRLDLRLPDAASGALHDTAILAPLVPSAILFVASRDGISHNPAEFSRIEHIALAARIVVEAISA